LLCLLAVGVIVLRARRVGIRSARVFRSVVLMGVGVLVCSAFWYVRAMWQAGDLFYPLTVSWGSGGWWPTVGVATATDVFPDRSLGFRVWQWVSYPWREAKLGAGYGYGVDNGLGAAFACFVPIGIALAGWRAWVGRGRGRGDVAMFWRRTILLLVGLAFVLLVTVFHDTLRFVLPLVLLAVPLAAMEVERACLRYRRVAVGLLCVALTMTCAMAVLKPTHSLLGRVRDDDWSRIWFYQIPSVVDRFEPGSRVLNLADEPLNYALLGEPLTNDVVSPSHWGVMIGGGETSVANLRANGIDYVFVRPPWPTGWVDSEGVELIYDDTDSRVLSTTQPTRIYRLNEDDLRLALSKRRGGS
jgi:hypothetical protein